MGRITDKIKNALGRARDKTRGFLKNRKAPVTAEKDNLEALRMLNKARGRAANRKAPKSLFGQRWDLIRMNRIVRGLPVSGEARRILRARMPRKAGGAWASSGKGVKS